VPGCRTWRAREASLRAQADALNAQLADREAYLKLADDLQGFLAQLKGNAAATAVPERQRVLRLLVTDVLIGPEKITIRHRIPIRNRTAAGRQPPNTPIRRVTMRQVIHCVGGVTTPPCGVPSTGVGANPLPASNTPALQPAEDHVPGRERPDGVMTARARPEPIGSGLEPGLPPEV
jgi:hypothetical protein